MFDIVYSHCSRTSYSVLLATIEVSQALFHIGLQQAEKSERTQYHARSVVCAETSLDKKDIPLMNAHIFFFFFVSCEVCTVNWSKRIYLTPKLLRVIIYSLLTLISLVWHSATIMDAHNMIYPAVLYLWKAERTVSALFFFFRHYILDDFVS